MNFKPCDDKIIVEEIKVEEKGAHGIIIPDIAAKKELYANGLVVAVGPGKYSDQGVLIRLDVHIEQHIMFLRHNSYGIKIEGKPYLVVEKQYAIGVY